MACRAVAFSGAAACARQAQAAAVLCRGRAGPQGRAARRGTGGRAWRSSGLCKAFSSSAPSRAGFSAGARPVRSGREGGALNARGTVGLPCSASFRGAELGPKVERKERQGPGRLPGRVPEVHHQPPGLCLRRSVPRSSIWEHHDFWGLRSSLAGCLRSVNSGFYA